MQSLHQQAMIQTRIQVLRRTAPMGINIIDTATVLDAL